MNWEYEEMVFEDCAIVHRVREEFGGLSNMATGYPLRVNSVDVWSSEALFQACRYPDHPEIQREIIEQRNPMAAKIKARKDGRAERCRRPDWFSVNVAVMEWCLRMKLAWNLGPIYWLLETTGDRAIVELSRKDVFWGAAVGPDGVLRGQNQLGRLWMKVREEARLLFTSDRDELRVVEPPSIPNFHLLGRAIETSRARSTV